MFYIRFGEIPKDERSSIYYRGMYCGKEEGVSVYDCAFIRGGYHIIVPCPITMGGLDTLTGFLFYNKDKPVYFVEGEQVGTGHDGEPLIHNIKIITDITDRFRNMQSSIDEDKLHNELLSLADKFKEAENDN